MSVGIRITTTDGRALAAMAQLMMTAENKTRLFDEIGVSLTESARLRFIDQAGPDGQPWVPSYRATNQGGETLRDKGILMNSLTHVVLADGVEYGTNVPYAGPLHFGAEIRAVNGPFLRFKIPGGGWVRKNAVTLPARPFLGINADDEQTISDIINDFLRPGLQ